MEGRKKLQKDFLKNAHLNKFFNLNFEIRVRFRIRICMRNSNPVWKKLAELRKKLAGLRLLEHFCAMVIYVRVSNKNYNIGGLYILCLNKDISGATGSNRMEHSLCVVCFPCKRKLLKLIFLHRKFLANYYFLLI